MRQFTTTDQQFSFNHHGDFSGDIIIDRKGGTTDEGFRIPVRALLEFVANIKRTQQIRRAEEEYDWDLLGINPELFGVVY